MTHANTWNYRIIETKLANGDVQRAIHEVYYVDGKPNSYTESPMAIVWEVGQDNGNADDGIFILEKMKLAFDKPILTPDDFKRPKKDYGVKIIPRTGKHPPKNISRTDEEAREIIKKVIDRHQDVLKALAKR